MEDFNWMVDVETSYFNVGTQFYYIESPNIIYTIVGVYRIQGQVLISWEGCTRPLNYHTHGVERLFNCGDWVKIFK